MPGVGAVLQHRDGRLHRGSWEAIAAAQRLARERGGRATAILLGHGVDALAAEAAASDLEAVRVLESPALGAYAPAPYVAALGAAVAAANPELVVFPHTYQSCEYVPRLAQASGAAHVAETIGFEGAGDELVFRRPILEGKMHARVRVKPGLAALVTLQSGAFPADGRVVGTAPVLKEEAPAAAAAPGREILGTEQAGGDAVDLTKAAIIVAVGRGVGGADKLGPVEELARLLQAEIGASRPVIDAGWLPRDRQIGSSGQTVSPRLYLALGISGAIQHLVGMKGSSVVVAVNKDPGAPIFKIAHYGVVGDVHEVVPALIEALRAARG
jgi:electron transfer flavoprotein alpha subunit